MKKLYEASNAIEAHMIAHLLEQHGIRGRVDGEFLQGGIGELPAAGLVRVMVDELDFEKAQGVVADWESSQPAETPHAPGRRGRGFVGFAAGLLAGIAGTWLFIGAPCAAPGWLADAAVPVQALP